MEFFARAPAIFAFLSGAKRRVGLHRFTAEAPYRGDLMTHRVQYNPHMHIAQYYAVLVETLAHDSGDVPMLKAPVRGAPPPMPRFAPAAADVDRVRRLLDERLGPLGDPLVLLNPNASDLLPLRRWPTERFTALAERILADYANAAVAVTGAPSERKAAEDLCRTIGSARVASLAGETTLRDLLTLYTLADVLITNDSGPGHFSTLTDIDAVVLFGPETPTLFGPLGSHCHILRADLACSPCVNALNHRFSPCKNNICMQAITVDDVYKEVARCLSARAEKERYGARCRETQNT